MNQKRQLQEILRKDYLWPDDFRADDWKRDTETVLKSLRYPMMDAAMQKAQIYIHNGIQSREQQRGDDAFLDPALLDQ